MTDRLVKVLQNGRFNTRGILDMGSFVKLACDSDETLKVTVDWSNWLDGDTIASSENEATGVTAGSITTSGDVNTFTVSTPLSAYQGGGYGMIEHRITTTTSGETKELRIKVQTPTMYGGFDYDYGFRL